MKRVYYVTKNKPISQYKNVGITKALTIAYVIMHNHAEYQTDDDESTSQLSIYCNNNAYELNNMNLATNMLNWALEDIDTHTWTGTSIETGDRMFTVMESLAAFTILDIYASSNLKCTSFRSIILTMQDGLNQWKKHAVERHVNADLPEYLIAYICDKATKMMNMYKLYVEYKTGDILKPYYFDADICRSYVESAGGTTEIVNVDRLCKFHAMDDAIKKNPYMHHVITAASEISDDEILKDFDQYCKEELTLNDREFYYAVFEQPVVTREGGK